MFYLLAELTRLYSLSCNLVSRHQVALLDYGQVKELPDKLRLGYANLVIAMADDNASGVSQSFW